MIKPDTRYQPNTMNSNHLEYTLMNYSLTNADTMSIIHQPMSIFSYIPFKIGLGAPSKHHKYYSTNSTQLKRIAITTKI